MKRVLLISIVSALCIAACGEKSNLGLKARPQPDSPANTAAKTSTEVVLLADAENKILEPNAKTTRTVNFGDESTMTSVLCVNAESATDTQVARIKILGKGQVLLPQNVEKDTAEKSEVKVDTSKEVLNVVCKAQDIQTPKLTSADNVATIIMTPDMEPSEIDAMFSRIGDSTEKVRIACAKDEVLKKASDVLYSEESGYPVNMIIGVNTKILVETKSSKEGRNYALISCIGSADTVKTEKVKTQEVKTELKTDEKNTATIEQKGPGAE